MKIFRGGAHGYSASPELLNALFESMSEGVLVVSPEGVIIGCNSAAEQILGLTSRELEGRAAIAADWQPLQFDGTAYPLDELPVAVALRTDGPAPARIVGLPRPDGRIVWMRVSAAPIRLAGPASSPVVATFTDITDFIRQQRELGAVREQLGFVIEGSNDGFFDLDLSTGAMALSARFCEMVGYAKDELAPHLSTRDQLLHPDDKARAHEAAAQNSRGETTRYEQEERLRHKDGHWVTVLTRGRVVARDADGVPTRVAGSFTDISARKAAEAALSESEAELSAYFESPAVGVAVIGPDDRWQRVNDRLSAMLGYSKADLAELTFDDVTHPDDRALPGAMPAEVLAGTRQSFALDKRYVRRDGSIFWALISVSRSRRADGTLSHRVAIIKDITDRKNAEQALVSALDENQQLVAQLRTALEEVKTLSGLLPICMHCKKIRDDRGEWQRLESYISKRTDALFSHGLCQACLAEYYPDADPDS